MTIIFHGGGGGGRYKRMCIGEETVIKFSDAEAKDTSYSHKPHFIPEVEISWKFAIFSNILSQK